MKHLLKKAFLLLALVGGATSAWADETIFSYTVLSTHAKDGTNISATGGTVDLSVNAVEEKNSQGYAVKLSGDAQYVKCVLTSGTLKTGDVISLSIYQNSTNSPAADTYGVTVASATDASSFDGTVYVSTSSGKNAYTGNFSVGTDLNGKSTFYVRRNCTSSVYCKAITITRPAADSRTDVTLAFASTSGSLDINAVSPSLPAVSSDPNVSAITSNITYSSSNTAVANVNESTGALTLAGIGTTTITARFAGDEDYKPASATYTLTVTDATKLGYTEVLNPDNKTLAARWYFGMANTTVTQTWANYYGTPQGAIEDNSTSATVKLNGTDYTNSRSWKKMQNGYIVEGKEQWVGYDITVDENYVLNLTHLDARILVADDTYKWYVEILDKNGVQVYKSSEQTTTKASTANLSTDISLSNLNGTVKVKLWVTQGGSTKYFSVEKLVLTGATAVDSRPERTITFAAGTGSGTAPADVTVRAGETFFFPKAPLLYKTGNTLTDWNDGTSDHKVGSSAAISDNTDLTAVFTPNTVALGDVATTVDWTFKTNNGAPTIAIEGAGGTKVYAQRTTIGSTPYDALMTIDATSGKFNNTSNATYAQVAANTTFTIPAVDGMVVTVSCNQNPSAVTDVTFDGNNADEFSTDPRTLTYTYSGSASTIDIVVANGGLYPDGISVAYPYVKSKYDAPTITVGDFDFENKGYKVTITASEGTLEVSTDGTNYTAQASPYQVNVTSTTHYYAKATGASYGDSDVADENVTNAFDGAKKYVAWVYESNYANAAGNYNIANDAIHTALGTVYNVVNVDIKDYKSAITDEQKTAMNNNLSHADLVVISEAAAGSSKAVIALKDIVGSVPMLNMKLFAYSHGRWAWGTPDNKGTAEADVIITPVSKLYKVLNGVTFDGNNVALFDYPNDGYNHIQYVDSWTAEPENDVVLATITKSEVEKPVMHASNSLHYFALGLSCDDFGKYNANAIAIVKNAAAMLIAGEDLDAEVASVPVTISEVGWATLYTTYPLNFSGTGLTAYTATCSESVVTLAPVDNVPANTGVVLKGAANDYDIPVIASSSTDKGNLRGSATEPTAYNAFDGFTLYVLTSVNEGANVQFNPVNSGSIAAGKAYLKINGGQSYARSMEVVFADDILTGINEAKSEVKAPMEGKFFENGKFVIFKKGMKFNANGQVIK